MKIISFNICIKIDNAVAIAEYLQAHNPDIICLQEVVRPLGPRAYPIYRSEETIRNILAAGYPYYFFAPEWAANELVEQPGIVNRDFGGLIEQGKLILSKYPIIHGYNYFYYKNYEFDNDRTNFYKGNDHGRTLQVADIRIGEQIIQVGNIHGSFSSDKLDTERSITQSKFILEKLGERNLATVLVGDFNVLPETESITLLNKSYTNANNTFKIPRTRVNGQTNDYIFHSPELKAKNLTVEIIDISDHYPLIMEMADPE